MGEQRYGKKNSQSLITHKAVVQRSGVGQTENKGQNVGPWSVSKKLREV